MRSQTIPQILYDVDQNFGYDIEASPQGSLGLVSNAERSKQRVLRRLLTNKGDYIFHPEYGAGLPAFVGQTLSTENFQQIKSLILANMFMEESVSQNPPPKILLQTIPNGLAVQINYEINPTKQSIILTFNVNP